MWLTGVRFSFSETGMASRQRSLDLFWWSTTPSRRGKFISTGEPDTDDAVLLFSSGKRDIYIYISGCFCWLKA